MILFCDGGVKPSCGAYGSFRIENNKGELKEILRLIEFSYPVKTNNQCEYAILFEALLYIEQMKPDTLTIYSDSQLMVRQLLGEYKIRDAILQERAKAILELLESFKNVKIIHVPRKIIVEKLGH
jgi:ribonuclease HI